MNLAITKAARRWPHLSGCGEEGREGEGRDVGGSAVLGREAEASRSLRQCVWGFTVLCLKTNKNFPLSFLQSVLQLPGPGH